MPNKLNIQSLGVFCFSGILIPFLTILFCVEFDKMQIPYTREYYYTQSVYSLFGDDWNLRFCALITVGALFILYLSFGGKENEENCPNIPIGAHNNIVSRL